MMIKRICWLFSKIQADEEIEIKLRDEWTVTISKSDLIKADQDVLTVFRAKGGICVVNPDQVIMAHTRKKGGIL